jgi:hypothetical protein
LSFWRFLLWRFELPVRVACSLPTCASSLDFSKRCGQKQRSRNLHNVEGEK